MTLNTLKRNHLTPMGLKMSTHCNTRLTGEFPPRLAATGELGYSGCEAKSKQQPADKQHCNAVVAVMPDGVVQAEEIERCDEDRDKPSLEQQHIPARVIQVAV